MTTNNKTTPAAHAAPKTGAGLTMLDPSVGYITIINTYAVAPERARGAAGLSRACNERDHTACARFRLRQPPRELRPHPGCELRPVVEPEAIAAARENPRIVALMREQLQIADGFTPIQYELRQSVAPAGE
jgi:hypothetical protein